MVSDALGSSAGSGPAASPAGRESAAATRPGARSVLGRPSTVYLVVCGLIAVLMVGHTVNRAWYFPDFWVWLGPVREFAARTFHPRHPLLAVDAPDSYMGPSSFLLGAFARVTGIDPLTVLAWSGLVNLAVVLGGLWYFARRLSSRAWTPPLLLGFTLLAWGWRPWKWSGYMSLNSLGTVLPLGSTLAFGLALYALGAWWAWLRGGARRHLVAATGCFVAVVLTHQPTAMWVGLLALGFLVTHTRDLDRAGWRDLAVAGLAGALLVLAWPFYSVVDLSRALGGFDVANRGTIQSVVTGAFLALPGVVAILWPLRRRQVSPLLVPLLLVGGVFVFGWVTDRGSLGRVLPGAILLAHLAMADWVAERVDEAPSGRVTRRWVAVGVGAVLVVGVVGTAPGWLRSVPRALVPDSVASRLRLDSEIEPLLGFRDHMAPDDVAAGPPEPSLAIGADAARAISVPVPEPFVPDLAQRTADAELLVDPTTDPGLRLDLLERYQLDWLVVPSGDAEVISAQLPGSSIAGRVDAYTLIRLAPTSPS